MYKKNTVKHKSYKLLITNEEFDKGIISQCEISLNPYRSFNYQHSYIHKMCTGCEKKKNELSKVLPPLKDQRSKKVIR